MNTYTNIICFLLITILYYVILKPKLTFDILNSPELMTQYTKENYIYLGIYFLLVLVFQFCINAFTISNKCGGSIKNNIATAGVLTFLPWTIIFGLIIIMLVIYPGFKSAFSDVVGYYYVSNSANNVLNDLLIDPDIYKKLDTATEGDMKKREAMQSTADLIIKLTGNLSILINQIVPSNFVEFWGILKPLMKDKYTQEPQESAIREQLLNIVETRDNVGESMWFIYTGILLISIVQYKITSRGCANDIATMQKNYQTFLDNEAAAQAEKDKAQSTVYTITN
jgi:hypothetical protein